MRDRSVGDGRTTDVADSDAEIAERARVDPAAFGELYLRYVDAVYWYCVRRVGDRWAAEDATGQVFVQALAAMPRFVTGHGTFRSWLFRITHNVAVDAARRTRPTVPLDGVETPLVDAEPTPEQALLAGEQERGLWRALGQLSEDQRAVVLLRLAGLTGAEISAALGRGRSWVDTTHFRAISRLRVLLSENVAMEEARDGGR